MQHFLCDAYLFIILEKKLFVLICLFIQVGSQISQMKMEWAGGFTWQSYNEDINSLGEESFTTVGLLEQINVTRDKTDYLWYTTL